ncbi:Not1 N-terminal domain, CCR4-Not complex component-domain-containing protein [Panaeolus papilionaceus]|nr:Not1 N-terminal domain, CCR4-Not complex component-domain-containing protein [Panaeolus papilionaceus]
MAARKLQTEIDRTLKKVSEGVELFESIYEKMQASTNQTQKEKSELDLKTQIKKLQRLRDQIKTWVASNDIKDKSSLLENRRLIETQMEKFKACEKEMKTKAFSKEGLIQAAKLDPKEQEKEEAIQWVNHQVEELQMQVETTEAELEALQGAGKKRKGASGNAGRQEELEHLNDRRKWHISRLEIVLRMINNGSLPLEKVNGLKEDVVYFVESNTEEDFDEDEGIYDDLHLDEEEEKWGLPVEDPDSDDSDEASEDVPPRPTKKHDEESVSSSKRDDSPILKKAAASLSLRKQSVDTKPPPNLNLAQQPMASVLKAGLPSSVPRPTPAVLPPIRYAAAAAAAVAPPSSSSSSLAATTVTSTPAATSSHPPPTPSTAPSILAASATAVAATFNDQTTTASVSSPSLTHLSVTSPMLSSAASASQQPDGSFYSGQESPALSEAVSPVKQAPPSPQVSNAARSRPDFASSPLISNQSPSVAQSQPTTTSQSVPPPAVPVTQPSTQSQQAQPAAAPSPLPQQLHQYAGSAPGKSPLPPQTSQQPLYPPGVKVPQAEGHTAPTSATQPSAQPTTQRPGSANQPPNPPARPSVPSAFPGSLSDLVVSFESVKQKALRPHNLDQVHKMLEGSYANAPQPQETEKPKYYVPTTPYQTAPYYPQTPHPLLNTPAIFQQLDVETLFWIFYYMPGTYQQYLAAKELKRQSWRFHLKFLTWFQRHSEPQAITEEYEQGVYVYFDWEGSWCQRKKSDFRFEYRYLSED